mgnify:CR=1 FL=1
MDFPSDTSFEILKLYSIFKSGNKNRAIPQSYIPTQSFFDKIASFIRLNFFIPDSRIGWNYFAFKKAKKLNKNECYEEIDTRLASGWYVDTSCGNRKKKYKTKEVSFTIARKNSNHK